MNTDDDVAIENFRTYLRIPSVQPEVDYSGCVAFLTKLSEELGLSTQILKFTEKKPLVLMTLAGTRPNLGSILLNSHMDVVPVYPELWHYDPFGAEIDEEGNIYGRGAQDTKSIGIQYLEAIRRLLKDGQQFQRTIHVLFVPDEENGIDGMEQLVASPYFNPLNVSFTLDEGQANPGPEYNIFYAEKAIWHVVFKVSGTSGHGSLVLPNTAGQKLRLLVDLIMDYRQRQEDQLDANPSLHVGDVTFVNFTMVEGGVAPNVVPAQLSATFDFRLAVDEDHEKFELFLQSLCDQSGGGIDIEYISKEQATPATPIDSTNPFWLAMQRTFNGLEQKVITTIFAGGTDSRFLRRVGIPCISFSPMNNTPNLAHANDEFLNKNVFLKGIEVYMRLIPALANLQI